MDVRRRGGVGGGVKIPQTGDDRTRVLADDSDMTTPLTLSERRTLEAMRLVQSATLEDDPAATGVLQGFDGIFRAARIVSIGRKPSEREIHSALQKLVERGLVKRTVLEGLGGSSVLYKLLPSA